MSLTGPFSNTYLAQYLVTRTPQTLRSFTYSGRIRRKQPSKILAKSDLQIKKTRTTTNASKSPTRRRKPVPHKSSRAPRQASSLPPAPTPLVVKSTRGSRRNNPAARTIPPIRVARWPGGPIAFCGARVRRRGVFRPGHRLRGRARISNRIGTEMEGVCVYYEFGRDVVSFCFSCCLCVSLWVGELAATVLFNGVYAKGSELEVIFGFCNTVVVDGGFTLLLAGETHSSPVV